MKLAPQWELPPEKKKIQRKAVRHSWITIFYLITVAIVLYLTLGSSQAMEAAFYEDLLSIIPPVVFLISVHFSSKEPNDNYPYGYHRVTSIAFLAASVTLFALSLWLIFEAISTLINQHHPTIGAVDLFGMQIWLGWLMIPALLYSGVPAYFFSRGAIRFGRDLHDKVLFADGKMRRADWLTSGSAIVGIVGISFGIWWADAVAALVIATDIFFDGLAHSKVAMEDIMERRPKTVDGKTLDVPERTRDYLMRQDWICDANVRFRESGRVLFGEAFVVPKNTNNLPVKTERAVEEALGLDWRIANIVITVLPKIDPP